MAETASLDECPDRVRRRFMKSYVSSVRRHLYATGGKKTLLVKNTSSAGRMRSLMETFPDARFVHLIRRPEESIPSLLSMYSVPWRRFVPQAGQLEQDAFARLYLDYYDRRATLHERLPPDRYVEIPFGELTRDPFRAITSVYDRFGISLDESLRARLAHACEKARSYESTHEYSLDEYGLDSAEIRSRMAQITQRLEGSSGLPAN
jgi:hypothetical protein